MNKKIVFLEDDLEFANEVCVDLTDRGYEVIHFGLGADCLRYLQAHGDCVDLCILDVGLPELSGVEVMRRLRLFQQTMPVILMTGNDGADDVAAALNQGADDYIVKPANIDVLDARINSLMRRVVTPLKPVSKELIGGLEVDYNNKAISRAGRIVRLTGFESILAFHLFEHRGQVVTRKRLYELLGISGVAVDTRRLDVHISHVRAKLGLHVEHGWRLASVYQRGYRLEYLNDYFR